MNSIVRFEAQDSFETIEDVDRRESQRSLLVYKVVKVSRGDREGLARCRNISDGGLNIECSMPISLGETLAIELTPDTVVTGRVAWTAGEQCGIAFDKSIDCAKLLQQSADHKRSGRARGVRLNSDIPARLKAEGNIQPTTISNISQQGMLVTHSGDFKPGLYVNVVLPNGSEKPAVVQWTQDNFAGLFLFEHFSVIDLGDIDSLR